MFQFGLFFIQLCGNVNATKKQTHSRSFVTLSSWVFGVLDGEADNVYPQKGEDSNLMTRDPCSHQERTTNVCESLAYVIQRSYYAMLERRKAEERRANEFFARAWRTYLCNEKSESQNPLHAILCRTRQL